LINPKRWPCTLPSFQTSHVIDFNGAVRSLAITLLSAPSRSWSNYSQTARLNSLFMREFTGNFAILGVARCKRQHASSKDRKEIPYRDLVFPSATGGRIDRHPGFFAVQPFRARSTASARRPQCVQKCFQFPH
jgi:hypothetical protein